MAKSTRGSSKRKPRQGERSDPDDLVGQAIRDPAVLDLPEVLDKLAVLSREEPCRFKRILEDLKAAGIPVQQVEKEALRRARARGRFTGEGGACYKVENGSTYHERLTREGPVKILLANFAARIHSAITSDDGLEVKQRFEIEGVHADGHKLPKVEVAAEKFTLMDWPLGLWGHGAVVSAGVGAKDHLRCAIQILSAKVERRTVYGHTGWRRIGERDVYLHASGGISADGVEKGVEVGLPPSLSRYVLSAPPSGAELVTAVKKAISLLKIAPKRISVPLLGAGVRAPLGVPDFSIHLSGATGTMKSELAARVQQFFGKDFAREHLPGSWSSTANATETLAFLSKDTVFTNDDFCPTGTQYDVQKMHRDADRLFRNAGNGAGRSRLTADASLRAGRFPRALIFSTGEDVPTGQSLRARILIVEVGKGDVSLPELTRLQALGAAGVFAAATAGYVQWIARAGLESIQATLRARVLQLRAVAFAAHSRTPGIVADLMAGLELFFQFAQAVGAITHELRTELEAEAWEALLQVAAEQAAEQRDSDPARRFGELLSSAISSGAAHLAGIDGRPPLMTAHASVGWRFVGGDFAPQGAKIGWIVEGELLLDPEASFTVVQDIARRQGFGFPVTRRTLTKRLLEAGLLLRTDHDRETLAVRARVEGRRRDVLAMPLEVVGLGSEPEVGRVGSPTLGRVSPTEANTATDAVENGSDTGVAAGSGGSGSPHTTPPQAGAEKDISSESNPEARGYRI